MTYDELHEKIMSVNGDMECYEGEDVIGVEEGEWIDEGKYGHQSSIYSDAEGKVFISVDWTRSGSYFTDYDYNFIDAYQVRPKIVTKTVYVPV